MDRGMSSPKVLAVNVFQATQASHNGNVIEQNQYHPLDRKDCVQQSPTSTTITVDRLNGITTSSDPHSTPLSTSDTRFLVMSRAFRPESLSHQMHSGYTQTSSNRLTMPSLVENSTASDLEKRYIHTARVPVFGERRPLRLRGGGSETDGGARAPNQNGSRSTSAAISATSEHDPVAQSNRESTTSSSSFDLQQYQAYTANGPMTLQPQMVPAVTTTRSSSSTQLTGSSNTSEHDIGSQAWKSGPHPGAAYVTTNPYQPVPLMVQHPIDTTSYATAGPAGSVPYSQQLESHSRSQQQPPRAYSVSDSVTSSGTSYNGYGQPTGDNTARRPSDNGESSGMKGKGRALDENDGAVASGGEYLWIPARLRG